jgi:hypothetical protein
VVDSTLVEDADMLKDEFEDRSKTLSAELESEDGFEVEWALDTLKLY